MCKNADINYLSRLYRVLNHKLSILPISEYTMKSNETVTMQLESKNNSNNETKRDLLSPTTSAGASLLSTSLSPPFKFTISSILTTINEENQILISGVITALGSILEAFSSWILDRTLDLNLESKNNLNSENKNQNQNENFDKIFQIINFNEKICNDLLNTINIILQLNNQKSNIVHTTSSSEKNDKNSSNSSTQSILHNLNQSQNLSKDNYTELKIVALRVLRSLASNNLMKRKIRVGDNSMNNSNQMNNNLNNTSSNTLSNNLNNNLNDSLKDRKSTRLNSSHRR